MRRPSVQDAVAGGVWGLFLAGIAQAAPRLMYAAQTVQPDGLSQFGKFGLLFLVGAFTRFCWRLSRVGIDKPAPMAQWFGDSLLGGFAGLLAAGGFSVYKDTAQPLLLVLISIGFGFFGSWVFFAARAYGMKRVGMTPPKDGEGNG